MNYKHLLFWKNKSDIIASELESANNVFSKTLNNLNKMIEKADKSIEKNNSEIAKRQTENNNIEAVKTRINKQISFLADTIG